MVSEDRLRTLLRVAESVHQAYEAERGEPDDDWPTWYASFIVERLREEPEPGASHVVALDDDEHRLLLAAVHAYLDDFGHDEADVLRRLKALHARLEAA